MITNRIKLLFLLAAAMAVLAVLLLLPTVKRFVAERGTSTVSLGESVTQQQGAKAAAESVVSMAVQNNSKEETEEIAEIPYEDMPSVTLRLETVSKEGMDINLWQSVDGTCYFFLPGYAERAKITLADADGGYVRINGQIIREGDTIGNILWGNVYQAEIGSAKEDEDGVSVALVFMHSSELPVLAIDTESGSLEQIHGDKTYTEEGTVVWQDEQGNVTYSGAALEIGGRGNSTWGLTKKPYQLKLYESVDLLGAGAAKSYNLLANGYDETRLRNLLAAELAEALGMDNVPQCRMIDLYINGYYHGNYYLTEKIAIEDAAAGDYLIERELEERYKTEKQGFVTVQGDCYVLQSPEEATEEQISDIADWMQAFQNAVEGQDGVNPENGKHYSEYIDVTSFVQKYLVEEISKNYDGGVTSSFFYKKESGTDHKLYAGPIWDYDVAFGNCNLDEIASNPLGLTKLSNHIYGTDLFAALYEQPDFYEQTVQMYEDKALPYLNSLLNGGIDQMAEESRLSAQMDSIRWESLENRYQYYENYDNDVRYLKYFIEKRRDFLSDIWLEEELYYNVNFVVDDEIWQILCVKDGELPMQEPVPFRSNSLFIGWYTKTDVPFDIYKPVYEDITYYAVWQELE